MQIPDIARYTAVPGLALALGVACGDGESTADAGAKSDGGSGGPTSQASGGSGGSGSGGSDATAATGGTGGVPIARTTVSSSVGSAVGGSMSSAGAPGDDPPSCEGLPGCDNPGWSCDGNTLVNCAETVDGCLIEMRTDCGTRICVEDETARCDNQGTSCADAWPITGNTVVRGTSFAADFGDGQNFAGQGCPRLQDGAPDAVFQVEVPGGSTVVVTEVGEHYAGYDTSIDAHFAVLSACSDESVCLASGDAPDTHGVSYTAEQDETIFVWVGADAGDEGTYEIRIEYATHLGRLGLGESVHVAQDGQLPQGELQTYHFELDEAGVVYGVLDTASSGDVDLAYVYDDNGELVFDSLTIGSEDFAVPLEPGSYRVVVFAYNTTTGYTLDLSVDPLAELGQFDIGDHLVEDFAGIAEGRSQFYRFFVRSTATIQWAVTNTEPADEVGPELAVYRFGRWLATAKGTDAVATLGGEAIAGTYLLQVLALPGAGDIPSHQLDLSFEPLPY